MATGATNQESLALSVTNIQSQLRFLPGDVWELDNFSANFAGAKLDLSGTLTNASAFRDWKTFHGRPEKPGRLEKRLRDLARTIDQIHFDKTPVLNVNIRGDARNFATFCGFLIPGSGGRHDAVGHVEQRDAIGAYPSSGGSNSLPTVKCLLKADDLKFELHPDSLRTLPGETPRSAH